MKIISAGTTFGYSSAYWTDTNTLNPTSPVSEEKDAKYSDYVNTPFSSLRMCVESPDSNCVYHKFSTVYSSARALFSAGYIKDTGLDQEGIESAFAVSGHKTCDMQVFLSLSFSP